MDLQMNNWGTFYHTEETMLQDDRELKTCTSCNRLEYMDDGQTECTDCKALSS